MYTIYIFIFKEEDGISEGNESSTDDEYEDDGFVVRDRTQDPLEMYISLRPQSPKPRIPDHFLSESENEGVTEEEEEDDSELEENDELGYTLSRPKRQSGWNVIESDEESETPETPVDTTPTKKPRGRRSGLPRRDPEYGGVNQKTIYATASFNNSDVARGRKPHMDENLCVFTAIAFAKTRRANVARISRHMLVEWLKPRKEGQKFDWGGLERAFYRINDLSDYEEVRDYWEGATTAEFPSLENFFDVRLNVYSKTEKRDVKGEQK